MNQQEIDRIGEANGWRHRHPHVLGHLTAAEARAIHRQANRLPAETTAEAAAAAAILEQAGISPDPIPSSLRLAPALR